MQIFLINEELYDIPQYFKRRHDYLFRKKKVSYIVKSFLSFFLNKKTRRQQSF